MEGAEARANRLEQCLERNNSPLEIQKLVRLAVGAATFLRLTNMEMKDAVPAERLNPDMEKLGLNGGSSPITMEELRTFHLSLVRPPILAFVPTPEAIEGVTTQNSQTLPTNSVQHESRPRDITEQIEDVLPRKRTRIEPAPVADSNILTNSMASIVSLGWKDHEMPIEWTGEFFFCSQLSIAWCSLCHYYSQSLEHAHTAILLEIIHSLGS